MAGVELFLDLTLCRNNPTAEKTLPFRSRFRTPGRPKSVATDPTKAKHLQGRRPALWLNYGRFRGCSILAAEPGCLDPNGFFPDDRLP